MLPRPVAEALERPVRDAAPRPPVLLTMAGHAGTLAAARCFGRAGIRVTVASDARFKPAAWSRHVERTVRCPPPSQPEKFMEWLFAFGKANPGHFLYPTCDDFAYLFREDTYGELLEAQAEPKPKRFLLDFVATGYLDDHVRPYTERLAARQVARTVVWD